ncbi:50S ribosomal protein L15 [bacterium]|nr:50S ribosomal protein L15 [bacterium]NUN47150.1 50S ribosomal protein L15 [bacterium]
MNLSNLTPAKGSRRKMKRIGRGEGSGHGGTSTRGNKGQKSRSGLNRLAGFEGGQMPLQRRLPKYGFTNIFRVEFQTVNLTDLAELDNKRVDGATLQAAGLIKKKSAPVKLLGTGEVTKAFEVEVHAISATAKEKIEKAGGKVTVLGIKKTVLEKRKKKASK